MNYNGGPSDLEGAKRIRLTPPPLVINYFNFMENFNKFSLTSGKRTPVFVHFTPLFTNPGSAPDRIALVFFSLLSLLIQVIDKSIQHDNDNIHQIA